MIVEFLFAVLVGFIEFIFSLFPNLPPAPSGVVAPLNFVSTLMEDGLGVVRYLFTNVVYFAVLFMFFAILVFEPVYNGIIYVYRKITALF